MRQFKLDERLKACADFITNGAKIVDVGTDHAYLPIWLIMNGKVSKAIASDINVLPVEKAKENVKKYRLEEKIKILKSDGLDMINPEEVDEIVIAGMGGELISNIIAKEKWIKKGKKRLILQPVSSEPDLRIYLNSNGFEIKVEKAVFSLGRVYTVINAVYRGDFFKEREIEYPYVGKLYKNLDKAAIEYLNRQIRDLENKNKGNYIKKKMDEYFLNSSIIRKIKKIIADFGGENLGP